MHKYHQYHPLAFIGLVSLCVSGLVLAGIASALPDYATLDQILDAISGTLLVADIILVLIADWQGAVTLNGRINWNSMSASKRFWLICLACIISPLLLVVYLAQIAKHTASTNPMSSQEEQQ